MTIPRHTRAALALALASLIACSACGSSGPPPPTLSQKILGIFSTADAALARDRNVPDVPLVYQKFSIDFLQADESFHKLTFPHSLKAKAAALETDLNKMSADAAALSKDEALSQSVLANVQAEGKATLTLTEDEQSERKASNALRRAVGLPEETTTTTSTSTPVLGTTTTAPSRSASTTTTKG
jgi:hypothetical protein